MSKIKNYLRGIRKIEQIFPDISIRGMKQGNSIISRSNWTWVLEKIDRKFDKFATAKQSQIIFPLRKFLEKYPQSTSDADSAVDSLNPSHSL